jgi:type IV pilus assembly protein PilO
MAIGANLTKRQQALVFIAVLPVALAGAYWYFMYRATTQRLGELQSHTELVEKSNEHAKQDLAKGTPKQLQAEAERYSKNLDLMRLLVPSTNEVPLLLDQVSTAARQAGLEIGQVQPQPSIDGDEFDTYRYSVGVIGDYHQIGSFLANVGGLTRIITPVDVKLHDVQIQRAGRKPRALEQLIQADLEIRTYVVRTRPVAADTARGGKQ